MIITKYYNKEEALKAIKSLYRPGCTYFVGGSAFLYTNLPDKEGNGGRGFPEMTAHVVVSQRQALKFINDLFGTGRFVKEDCKIKIGSSTTTEGRGGCIFIG